jgi:hypothetical protein
VERVEKLDEQVARVPVVFDHKDDMPAERGFRRGITAHGSMLIAPWRSAYG